MLGLQLHGKASSLLCNEVMATHVHILLFEIYTDLMFIDVCYQVLIFSESLVHFTDFFYGEIAVLYNFSMS